MTDDLSRRDDPAAAPAPAPVPTPTPGAGGPVPAYIPAGVIARPAPAKSSRGGLLTGALVIAALIAAAGVGFAGGRVTAPAAAATNRGNAFGGAGAFPNASGRGNGGAFGGGAFAGGNIALDGSVVAVGDGTITIQPTGGTGTVVISVPSTATYHSQGSASSADVAVGTSVQVTVSRGQFRAPDASGAPGAASASPGANGANGANGFNLTATDITVTGK
jgi:hypothetical protein